MVHDYAQRCYLPAQARWDYLTKDNMKRAKVLAAWKANTQGAWSELAIKDVQVEVGNSEGASELDVRNPQLKVGSKLKVNAVVKLGRLKPDDVSVELYHGPLDSRGNITDGAVIKMDYKKSTGQDNEHLFCGLTPCCASGRRGIAVRLYRQRILPPTSLGWFVGITYGTWTGRLLVFLALNNSQTSLRKRLWSLFLNDSSSISRLILARA
jgi:starch phosphorylase